MIQQYNFMCFALEQQAYSEIICELHSRSTIFLLIYSDVELYEAIPGENSSVEHINLPIEVPDIESNPLVFFLAFR